MRYKTLIVMIFAFVFRFTLQKRMEMSGFVKVQAPVGFELGITKVQVKKSLSSGRPTLKFWRVQRKLFNEFLAIVGGEPANGKYDLQKLGKLTHKILVSILRNEIGLERSNLTIVEQVLAVHMIDPDPVGSNHQVRYINLFMQRCAHIQHILLSTLVHTGVLKGFEAEYNLPLVNRPTAEDHVLLDEPDEDDDEPDEDDDETDEEDDEPDEVDEPYEVDEPKEVGDSLEHVEGLDSDILAQGTDKEVDEEMADLAARKADESATTQVLLHLSSLGENVDNSKPTVTDDGLLEDLDDDDDDDDDLLNDSKDDGIFADADIGGDKAILKCMHSFSEAASLTLQSTILDFSRIICIIYSERISLTKIHD